MRVLMLMLLLPFSVFAQGLDIYGYFEPQYMGAKLGDHFYHVASNKLRVDLAKSLGDNVTFGANFNYITFHGKTEWNILDYLPSHIAGTIPPQLENMFVFHFGDMVQQAGPITQPRPDRIFLDNAFLRLSYKKMDITVGKQQLGMGAGYTWNPTDLFNVKNVLDPTYEQPGHNAVRLEYQVHKKLGIDAMWSPGEEFEDSHLMIRLKSNISHFDFTLLAAQQNWQRSDFLNMLQPYSSYRRSMFGGDFSGELLGLGIWGEGGYNIVKLKTGPGVAGVKDFWELVIGSDYTFNSGLYAMAEFYHASQAPDRWQDYSLNDWLWYYSTETRALGRDNLFAMLLYPATDLLNIGIMLIENLGDGSATIAPNLTWSLFEDVELMLYLNYATGREGRAFASNLGSGGLARLRIYF